MQEFKNKNARIFLELKDSLSDGKCFYPNPDKVSLEEFQKEKWFGRSEKIIAHRRDASYLTTGAYALGYKSEYWKPIKPYQDEKGIYVLAKDLLGELDYYAKKK